MATKTFSTMSRAEYMREASSGRYDTLDELFSAVLRDHGITPSQVTLDVANTLSYVTQENYEYGKKTCSCIDTCHYCDIDEIDRRDINNARILRNVNRIEEAFRSLVSKHGAGDWYSRDWNVCMLRDLRHQFTLFKTVVLPRRKAKRESTREC